MNRALFRLEQQNPSYPSHPLIQRDIFHTFFTVLASLDLFVQAGRAVARSVETFEFSQSCGLCCPFFFGAELATVTVHALRPVPGTRPGTPSL